MRIRGLIYTPLLLVAIIFISGCNQVSPNPPQSQTNPSTPPATGPALTVQETESPSGPDSREPELTASADGRVILSWVEKVGKKRYALRFASRDAAGGWLEASTVAEGENWFVNWADFPSVIELSDGSLAAHWLVKSGPGTYAYDVNIARSNGFPRMARTGDTVHFAWTQFGRPPVVRTATADVSAFR